ncbi:hypothetical protein BH23BAC3_BH23BAC3_24580 [soil metagenome]
MSKPLVTIAIPTYNRADGFLKDSLESALNQTYQNIEIIVSDNNSTDHTEAVVTQYKDERIRYFKQKENLGPFKNWNFCLQEARGDYFLMLHDDDLIDPDFIEKCLLAVKFETNKGIIIAGSRVIDEDGNVKHELENSCSGLSAADFLIKHYEKKVHLFLCSILLNTKKFREVGGFNEYYRYLVDVAAHFEMIAKTERVDVPEVLGSFRAHSGSFGKKSKMGQWSSDSLKLLDLACSLVDDEEKKNKLRTTGMETSAERMYRYATYRSEGHFERCYAYFSVWSTFNYRHLPPKKHLYSWLPFLRFILSPRSSLTFKHKNR